MNSGNELLGYGQYLKQVRCEKNISLDRVSQITKVSVRMLELIEAEADDQLPEDLYVKNFIRLYAKALGIDEKKAVSRYRGKTHAFDKHPKKKPFGFAGKRFWLVVIAVLVLAAAAWRFMALPHEQQRPPEGQAPPEAATPAAPEAKTPVPEGQYSIYGEEKIQPKPLILTARAVEKTWLKVIADGQRPMEYMLDKDEEITLEAKTGFDLLIENAGGITLELNGEPVNVPGRNGQVASLKLP